MKIHVSELSLISTKLTRKNAYTEPSLLNQLKITTILRVDPNMLLLNKSKDNTNPSSLLPDTGFITKWRATSTQQDLLQVCVAAKS